MPRLSEQEQQEVIRYIEADKPLEKLHFLLFEDKREVESVWKGKANKVYQTDGPLENSFFRIFIFVILRVVPKDLRGATARRGRAVALSEAKGLRRAMRFLRSVDQLLEGH
jgi:hypothetical protein